MEQRNSSADTITPQSLREADAARYLEMSVAYLRGSRVGRCPGPAFVRLGRSVRYLRADLDQFLDERRVTPKSRLS